MDDDSDGRIQDHRSRVESLGIGAAQEFFFAGRDIFRAIVELTTGGPVALDPFRNAIERVREAIDGFHVVIDTIADSLPLPQSLQKSIRELPWNEIRNRGVDEGFLSQVDDRVWRCVVSSIKRGNPLVPVELVVSELSTLSGLLKYITERLTDESDRGVRSKLVLRVFQSYFRASQIGLASSYANMIVGRMRGVQTVPGTD